MDEGKIMGLVLLSIPWAKSVLNILRHIKKGRMVAYKKRVGDGFDSVDEDDLSYYMTNPKKHPISYWLLLAFYWFIAIAVPAVALYVVFDRVVQEECSIE